MNLLETNSLTRSPWLFETRKYGGKTGKKRRNKSIKNKTRKRRPRIYK